MPKLSDIKTNPIIKSILLIIIVLYTTMAAPKIPPSMLKILHNPLIKVLCMFLILFFANVNPLYALASSVILLVTLQLLRDFETGMHIMKNCSTDNSINMKKNITQKIKLHDTSIIQAKKEGNLKAEEEHKNMLKHYQIMDYAINEIENEKQLENQALNTNNESEAKIHKHKKNIYEKIKNILNQVNNIYEQNEKSNNIVHKQHNKELIITFNTQVDALMKNINYIDALYHEQIKNNPHTVSYYETEINKMDVIYETANHKLQYLLQLYDAKIDNNEEQIKLIESNILKQTMKINSLMVSSILKEESNKAKMNGDNETSDKLYKESVVQELKAQSIINSDHLNELANESLMKGDNESAKKFINDSNNELVVAGTIEECEQHYIAARNAEQLGDDETYKAHIKEYNKLQCKINDELINKHNYSTAEVKSEVKIKGTPTNLGLNNSCNLTDQNYNQKHVNNQQSELVLNISGYSNNTDYASV